MDAPLSTYPLIDFSKPGVLDPSLVGLRVGSKLFHVTRATLCAQKGSMFFNLFAGSEHKHPPNPLSDGTFFIDGNPEEFTEIIKYTAVLGSALS